MKTIEKIIPQLLPSEQFVLEVHREMLRSDRTAAPLTFLIFDLERSFSDPELGASAMECLGQVLCKIGRLTDTLGWYEEDSVRRLGIILHQTGPDKAPCVIEKVRQAFAAEIDRLPASENGVVDVACQVYAYPASALEASGADQVSLFDERESESCNSGSPVGANGTVASQKFSNGPGSDPVECVTRSNVGNVFARPLPLWKRSMDIIGSSLGLVVLSPLLLLIALAIKLTSRGPVFFKQERIGYQGKPFMCWKFRTMRTDYDQEEHKAYFCDLIDGDRSEKPMSKLDCNNKRITWIGCFLRKSCLDELPQLFNVLVGEMSIVGPRPCIAYEAQEYLPWHMRRFDTTPGITGLWQVMGKNRTSFKQMIRLDIKYILNQSLLLDVKILLLTVPAVMEEIRQGLFR